MLKKSKAKASQPILMGQVLSGMDPASAPNPAKKQMPIAWVKTYNGARVFGTTLGHGNETMRREVYLDLVTRGLLWACDKLDEDGKPKAGFGKQ